MPECQKTTKGALDQYGPEHSEVTPLGLKGLNEPLTFHMVNLICLICRDLTLHVLHVSVNSYDIYLPLTAECCCHVEHLVFDEHLSDVPEGGRHLDAASPTHAG